ncbi:manganese peroxidase isozyme precursor [Irpex rosettiformis]|uniref:Manganese peroxidase isozyme n=1 Tax=Irpex rosettiformis TaxID=378272 RepID=A0ACB8U6I3_9APHY|nr:manganese peroxidase isozyme precursor [Irpex rosettiformis]
MHGYPVLRPCMTVLLAAVACTSLLSPQTGVLATQTLSTRTNENVVQCDGGRETENEKCCIFYDVRDDLQANLFNGGKCDDESREALRMMFHDAISYSTTDNGSFSGGGADGSIVEHAEIEALYPENAGLDDMAFEQRAIAQKYSVPLHFAGAIGLSNCAGAPRLHFFAGRNVASQPAPDGLVPAPFHSVDQILARMGDAGFSPEEVVTLLASHSIGTQHHVDPTIDGMPLDSTPEEFDTQFFLDIALKGTYFPGNGSNRGEAMPSSPNQLRIQSDNDLARDPRTSCIWKSYINNQEKMNRDFVAVMRKLSTLGQDMSKLIDCSDVIPTPKPLPQSRNSAVLPPGKTIDDIETPVRAKAPSRRSANLSDLGRPISLCGT